MKWITQSYKWLKGYKTSANSKGNYSKRWTQDLEQKVKRTLMSCTTVCQMKSALRYCELAEMTDLELYKQYSEFKNNVTEGL